MKPSVRSSIKPIGINNRRWDNPVIAARRVERQVYRKNLTLSQWSAGQELRLQRARLLINSLRRKS